MKINWFTVIAQVINFLILVWLLKKFLYTPILKAVSEREKKITDQINDADNKKSEAQKEQEDFRKKNEDIDRQKKSLLQKAIAEADAEKQKLIEEAKAAANVLRLNLDKATKDKQQQSNGEITRKIQKQVFAIARNALTDIASISLEEQSVNKFIERIKELKNDEKTQFLSAFKLSGEIVLVKSAFELLEKQKENITEAVSEILNTKTILQFKTAPEVISGIELSTKGYKIAWSFSAYVNALEKNVFAKMQENEMPETEKI
ncbi:MAG: hypothetical protein ABIT58_08660 [Ferruginibacter sp.]